MKIESFVESRAYVKLVISIIISPQEKKKKNRGRRVYVSKCLGKPSEKINKFEFR